MDNKEECYLDTQNIFYLNIWNVFVYPKDVIIIIISTFGIAQCAVFPCALQKIGVIG